MNPFTLLGVAETANDEQIKTAYLAQVRRYPPERAPQQFQAVRTAYETIRSRRDRLRYRLFLQQPPSVDELLANTLANTRSVRPTMQLLQRALAEAPTQRR